MDDNIIVKYSQFFLDDGGLQQVKKDFIKLGDELIDEAEKIKKKVNDAFSFGDSDQIEKAEKETESLVKMFKKLGDAREAVTKVEEEYQKLVKKGADTTEDQIESLTELDKQLNEYRLDLKKANVLEKDNIKTGENVNKIRVEAQINIKKTQAEIRKLQKEVIQENKLSKEEEKLIKAKITLRENEARTIVQVRERIAALRVVVQNLDLEEEAESILAYNNEINDLTEVLGENSDKFIQSKINIGNYEESILSALNQTSLFSTGVGFLDGAIGSLVSALTLTGEQLDTLEDSLGKNTSALKRFSVGFGRLNKVLKASIIGTVLVALAALVSLFGNTRAGSIRLEKVTQSLTTAFTGLGVVARVLVSQVSNVFDFIKDLIGLIGEINVIKILTGDTEELTKAFGKLQETAKKNLGDLINSFSEVGDAFTSVGEAIVEGLDNIERAFQLEDQIRRLERNLARLQGTFESFQSIADDSTRSLSAQLAANARALEVAEQIAETELDIANKRLESVNERLKQNIKANVQETKNIDLSKTGLQFAEAVLDLSQQRGSSLEISNDLLEEQQQAVLEIINTENELNQVVADNGKQRREIQRDIFEQNLDLLIDLIDTEKNLSEQLVNNISINFRRRVNEFNRFLVVFRTNAQRELDEFTKNANQNGLDLDFQIEFNDDGSFQVFINDQELAIDNIVDLNEQLQGLGLNEITINRFREFIVESRNGVRDFRDLNKELVLVGINVRQLRQDIISSQGEIDALANVQEKINDLISRSRGNISNQERKQILEDLEELEKQKTAIAKFAEFERLQNRRQALLDELETVEEASVREAQIKNELLEIDKKLLDEQVAASIEATKKTNIEAIDRFKKFADELNRIAGLLLDKLIDVNKERVKDDEERRDKQEEQVERQEERARTGLENTLAFEQKALAQRESELLKQQQRQETLEKIKSLYSAYSNYASRGEENPILKTLRDFAILESITASFKEGGITGADGVKTNARGITMGASHNPNGTGGNFAWHERGEGFLSRKEISNMGEANFYNLKQLASSGPLSENFFSGQRDSYMKGLTVIHKDSGTSKGLKDIQDAIERKPVPSLNVPEVVDGVLEFVERIESKNKVTRNHYRVYKKRL